MSAQQAKSSPVFFVYQERYAVKVQVHAASRVAHCSRGEVFNRTAHLARLGSYVKTWLRKIFDSQAAARLWSESEDSTDLGYPDHWNFAAGKVGQREPPPLKLLWCEELAILEDAASCCQVALLSQPSSKRRERAQQEKNDDGAHSTRLRRARPR
jgi:hypothetical protein